MIRLITVSIFSTMADKKVLRQVYLEKRLTLTEAEYQRRNILLQQNILEQVDMADVKVVHIFLSIVRQKEIDTDPIIKLLKSKYPILQFVISKALPDRQLEHFIYDADTLLETSSWGIPEPTTGIKIDEQEVDLIFVPLIICDKKGFRIGYGGGYYDIFLSKIPKAKKIGLSLSPLLDEIFFTEPFDIKLDACITPFEFYNFK